MQRRALLTTAGVTITSIFAGCLAEGGGNEEPISVSKPTVTRGETAYISIEALNLSGLRISEFPSEKSLDLGDWSFDPSPKATFDVFPPYWEFSGDDTTGEIPIQTTAETPPDSYQFELTFEIGDEEETHRKETAVTVEEA